MVRQVWSLTNVPLHRVNQELRIRLRLFGCTNRQFFHLVVTKAYCDRDVEPLDTIGTYDPMANDQNEILVALNFDKLQQWIARGAKPTSHVSHLLGLSGFYPINPNTEVKALRVRRKLEETSKHNNTEDVSAEGTPV